MLSTMEEAADALKISLNHAKTLIKAGRWPIYKISERVTRVDIDEILRLSRKEKSDHVEG